MLRRTPSIATSSRGFTLAEILIATLIVGLVMIAVATVLRTAMRSWQVGHELTETVQTARVAQDVVLRDLHNIIYLSEGQYNQTFQRGLQTAANQYQDDYDKNHGMITPDDRFDWGTLTPPIDLSFRVEDGENTDRLTFVRAHQARYPGDPNTWGLRRVTYYVEDKTLFRREDDPYGYRIGAMDESAFNPAAHDVAMALADYFSRPDPFSGGKKDSNNNEAVAPQDLKLPQLFHVAEPLCDGVEMFNITLGYFKENQWHEVGTWDSTARQFRQPPDISKVTDPEVLRVALATFPDRITYDKDGNPTIIQNRGQPDDLPGYIAIQVGVRPRKGTGRLHSFTFFHAISMAEERDVLILPPEGEATLPDPELSPSHGRTGRRGGRHR